MSARRRIAGAAPGFVLGALVLGALALFAVSAASAAVEVRKVVSRSGIVAWLVEDHSNPILSMSFGFRAGGSFDPAGKEGLAELASILLDEGAGPMDALAFQKKLENLSIRLNFEVGRDQFHGSLRTLSRNRDAAFEMIGLALARPRFDADAVERMRAGLLSGYLRDSRRPRYLARRAFWSSAFPDHPYGRPVSGTTKSLGAIARADLERFVADNLTRDNLFVGVVGDVTPAQLAVLLDKAFGSLPAKRKSRPVPAAAPKLEGGLVVKRFDTPQSVAMFGQPGLPRRHPDYYAAYVLNHILGGGFTSRLYLQIREKRGLAYSVYSYLWPMRRTSLLLGAVATENARVAESVAIIRKEWTRIAEAGPTAEELAAARKYLTGSYPLRFSSSSRIADMLVGLQFEGLERDYFARRNGYIEKVTLADVRRVAKSLLKPGRLTFFIVGKPAGL
ncbi:MAG: insulinase family protein [Rhodospirillaceae bacterium]|nr:insulinase family protein [Rhodospirillaceae bacterium]MYK59249.1 insulinase family protein [Rhodospirillaceae bacterium]